MRWLDFLQELAMIRSDQALLLKYVLLLLIVMYALYAMQLRNRWISQIHGRRVPRCNDKSPSFFQRPVLRRWKHEKERIERRLILGAEYKKNSYTLFNSKSLRKKSVARERAKRINRIESCDDVHIDMGIERRPETLSIHEKADSLSMDHVFVNLLDYLWAYTFIGPLSVLKWKVGVTILRLRICLQKYGLVSLKECDYDVLAAKLCLEQTQAIHCSAQTIGSDQCDIVGFIFVDFPYVDNNCRFKVASLFSVDVDLKTRKFVSASLDEMELTSKEAVILLWFNTFSAQHVKIHSLANWGVNVDGSLANTNPFFRRNSIATVMYNHYGYAGFNTYLDGWVKQGLLSEGWASTTSPLLQCFDHGIKSNVVEHSQVLYLFKHSRLVRFIVLVRLIFLSEFAKFKTMFPGVDGEALFSGTVLHSLDHTIAEWNMEEPLWLDVNCANFGKMAELGRIIRVGFLTDVKGIYFHKRFKGSGHPFYEAVYQKAAKIDLELADHMDTCIIK